MKRVGFGLLLLAVVAGPAAAGVVNVGSSYGPYQTGNGGEFTLNVVSGLDTSSYAGVAKNQAGMVGENSFQTFCIENSSPAEYIEKNTTYNVTLNRNAVNGGVGGGASGDPLSVGTGWLYRQFATGTLTGYDYTNPGRGGNPAVATYSAYLLQQAIWWLEQEGGVTYNASNIFMQAAYSHFGNSEAGARFSDATTGAWNYGVYALNMKKTNNVQGQDQLFYVPDGGTTLALLGCALMGIGALRRKLNG